jgi:hypothetical protein
MPSQLVTSGNSELYYHQVGLGFAKGVVDGVDDGRDLMTPDQKVDSPAVRALGQ